jgi:hypothetical protein
MLFYKNITGELGNQLLFYNNFAQIAHAADINFDCSRWEHSHFFNFWNNKDKTLRIPVLNVNSTDLIDIFDNKKKFSKKEFYQLCQNNNVIANLPFLGELFFEYNSTNPNQFISLKDEYQIQMSSRVTNIAIHIRNNGTAWDLKNDNKSYLISQYYIDAINYCLLQKYSKPVKFYLVSGINSEFLHNTGQNTDVYPPYLETEKYLIDNNINFDYCYTAHNKNSSFIFDFGQIMYSDVVISSVSTFCICASYLGKPNKKIIHNREWIEYASNKNDRFWKDLHNGGNEYYKIHELI